MNTARRKKYFSIIKLCLLTLLAFSANLFAQRYDNPGLGEIPVAAFPQDYKPLGVRAGGFMLHPGIQLAAEFTDNVFYLSEFEESDTIWHIRPYITAQSNWSRHSLNVRLAADVARFNDFGSQDYEDYFFLVNGQVDVRNRSYFSYNFDYMHLHEGRNTRDAQLGVEPTEYDLLGAALGYDHTFNRLALGIRYEYRNLDFDNAYRIDGEIIDNQDRDRDESQIYLRAGYQFQTDKQAFVSVAADNIDYDQTFDRNGLNRDSDGWTANAGLRFTLTGVLQGDVFASYHDQKYDDPRLPNVNGWAAGMGLQWNPTRLTSVSGRISSAVEQTTYQYSSGYLRTLYTFRVNHELLRNLQISGQVSYSNNDYQLLPNAPATARDKDKIWTAGVGGTYFFNRHVFLNGSYSYNKLESNLPLDQYKVNQFWLVLGLER
jgi:hypothetical protein